MRQCSLHNLISGLRYTLLLVDAAAAVTKMALARLEVVADLVNLHNRFLFAHGAWGATGNMGEAARIPALAGTLLETEARAAAAGLGGGDVVGEAALVTALALALFEGETFTRAFLGLGLAAGSDGGGRVAELASVALLAAALVKEGIANLLTGRTAAFGRCTWLAFMLAGALIALLTTPSQIVAAHFVAHIAGPVAAGIIRAVGEAALVAVGALAGFAEFEAFTSLAALKRGFDRLAL